MMKIVANSNWYYTGTWNQVNDKISREKMST